MSTAVISPVNPMSAEGKDTVMTVMRRDRENFTRLVSDPKNWNVDTRCTGWEVRDLVGHMIDVMEGYFKNWDAALAGKDGTALGLPVMGETLNDHALEFRKLSREEALERLKKDAQKLDTIDEATAGLILPFAFVFWQYTVDEKVATDQVFTYGIQVDGPWGGKWRATVKDGAWSAQPESGNFEGCDALIHFNNAADAVLTFFQRFPGGSASGDEDVINTIRRLHFRF